MDAAEQIRKFVSFFEEFYKKDILESSRKGDGFVVVDFKQLVRFDPKLSEELLESPEETIRAAELALEDFDLETPFRIRFKGLPESQKMAIKDLRSVHLQKFIVLEGIVRQKSDVRPQVTSARFECPSCGNIITLLQLDSRFKEPTRCGCGRKGKFRLVDKELVDAQGLVLEEAPESLEGGEQPKRINVLLKADLVSPIGEKKTNPGSKIRINGILKEVPVFLRSGSKSTRFDLLFEANYVEPLDETFYDLNISKEEEREIKKLAKDPNIFKKLIDSFAPSIYGLEKVKEAMLLQLFGGVRKRRSDGGETRADIHVLLVGDPGSGKSALLKRICAVAPKGRYVSGKGVSAAGLTASVTKDEFLKGWSLEAGAMVLASNGICVIDEMDKMSPDDRAAMHEAMENQTISISKANIQATLVARTTVLAAANPKFGRFDPYDILAKQIDLPPTLINRFDLIFPIKDLPDQKKDEEMAMHILSMHQSPDVHKPAIPTPFLRKYIAYARQKIQPRLSQEALEEVKRYFVSMRNKENIEGAAKVIPISARQLEALIRLAEACARARLSKRVTKADAKRAIDLLHYCLMQVGFDPETGKIDIDRLGGSMPASQRSKIFSVKELLVELEPAWGKSIPIEQIVKSASERGLSEDDVEEALEKLKRSGDIFEPKRGFVSRI